MKKTIWQVAQFDYRRHQDLLRVLPLYGALGFWLGVLAVLRWL